MRQRTNWRRNDRFVQRVLLLTALVPLLFSALFLYLGQRDNAQARRLVAEGRLAQGTFAGYEVSDCSDSSSNSRKSSCTPTAYKQFAYTVAGNSHTLTASTPELPATSMFTIVPSPTPRLGPVRPGQVVYLPADPEIARLRHELTVDWRPYLASAAIGVVMAGFFGFAALFVFRPKKRDALFDEGPDDPFREMAKLDPAFARELAEQDAIDRATEAARRR